MCNAVDLSTRPQLAVELSARPQLTVAITATGARGKSAYEAALSAGFSGTELEFGAGLAQLAGGAALLTFPTAADFPPVGRESVLYLDQSTNCLYRYDAALPGYRALETKFPQIAILSGGSAR